MSDFYLHRDFLRAEFTESSEDGVLLRWANKICGHTAPVGAIKAHQTLRFQVAGRYYSLRIHRGISWAEIAHNLRQLRLPLLGTRGEYRAVQMLNNAGIKTITIAAYAHRGINPARRQSMLVTEELVATVGLDKYCRLWATSPPPVEIRIKMIVKLADMLRRMHAAGIIHRQLHLRQFHLDPQSLELESPHCYVINLQRAQLRRGLSRRGLVRDLGGLYFSAMDCALSRRDILRFLHHYTEGGLRQALSRERRLWRRVVQRAQRLYRKEHRLKPPVLRGLKS